MQASAARIWASAQEKLRSMLSADTYNLWFAPLRASAAENNNLILEVANDFCEVWLKDNYLSLLQDVLAHVSGRPMLVKFKVASATASAASVSHGPALKAKAPELPADRLTGHAELNFNPKYTFDNFVV